MDGPIRGIYQRVIETAAPAAGAESITTVPAGKYWRLASFIISLVTSATVANRLASIVIDDGVNVLASFTFTGTAVGNITASSTKNIIGTTQSFTSTGTIANTGGIPLPDPMFFLLQPGWRVRTLTDLIQVGDQYGIARLVVQEFEG